MNAYNVTFHREGTQEAILPSFKMDVLPYPGLRILHAHSEWEVRQVRLHIRSENSIAAQNGEPHLVDVLAVEVEGMFA